MNEDENKKTRARWFTHPWIVGTLGGLTLGVGAAFITPSNWLVVPLEPESVAAQSNAEGEEGDAKVFYA